MIIQLIEINQPIGSFYISALPAKTIIQVTDINRRSSGKGIQRDESKKRIKDIAKYCFDPDAAFPTPIIIAVYDTPGIIKEQSNLEFDEMQKLGEIIDGQHRVLGLQQSGLEDLFTLPVVLMFDLTEEEKAYIFSIINSTQTKVSMSLIYDLFELSEGRSPQKTCHEIARLLNSNEKSPFYKRLKMLGKKENETSTLSQGTFVKYLLPLISKNPTDDAIRLKKGDLLLDNERPFGRYFYKEKDEIIYKILENMFSAVKEVFPKEWDNPNQYILTKTTGYGAIMKAFPSLYARGAHEKRLSKEFFIECFDKVKKELKIEKKVLTSTNFGSGEQGQRQLANLIIQSNEKFID